MLPRTSRQRLFGSSGAFAPDLTAPDGRAGDLLAVGREHEALGQARRRRDSRRRRASCHAHAVAGERVAPRALPGIGPGSARPGLAAHRGEDVDLPRGGAGGGVDLRRRVGG